MDRTKKITLDCGDGSGVGENNTLLSRISICPEIRPGAGCIRRIVLGEGLVRIEPDSFVNYSIETIAIPKSVTIIGRRAFYRCLKLREVEFAEGSKLRVVGEESFRESGLKDVAMPQSIRMICAGAFSGCKALEVVSLNEGLEGLGTDVGS